MFELMDGPSLARAEDAVVVAAIEDATRAEAAAAAARLAAIAELTRRRVSEDADERGGWVFDGWDAAAAEVAAAMGIGARRAATQMHLARALAERLPEVARLLRAGVISVRVAATIAWRTHLVAADAQAAVDAGIAAGAGSWGTLSDSVLTSTIDAVLARHDPDAVRQFREATRRRDVQFGKPDDATGTASVFGALYASDAALAERRIRGLIAGVCAEDPRNLGERRSDAVGVIMAHGDRLVCRCGRPQCPQAGEDSTRAGSVIIHVLAEQSAVDAARAANAPAAPAEPPAGKPAPAPAVLVGGGMVPGPLLAELIRTGATIAPLRPPCADGRPELRYRPSTGLARFVRLRDLTCRFPGCSAPAGVCDIDHAIAYPDGPTHPSNLRCLCRKHHLCKTFWDGWSDRQRPDGTIVWTSPAGRTYTTTPGSRILFPDQTLATPPSPMARSAIPAESNPARGLAMPRRRRTRAADQAQRIKTERAANALARTERKPRE